MVIWKKTVILTTKMEPLSTWKDLFSISVWPVENNVDFGKISHLNILHNGFNHQIRVTNGICEATCGLQAPQSSWYEASLSSLVIFELFLGHSGEALLDVSSSLLYQLVIHLHQSHSVARWSGNLTKNSSHLINHHCTKRSILTTFLTHLDLVSYFTWAMPAPINPPPITTTFSIHPRVVDIFLVITRIKWDILSCALGNLCLLRETFLPQR